jgi:nitroreductase
VKLDILEGIFSRRSVRNYTSESVGGDHVLEIIKAGMWAPSGLNNQPWRFVVIKDGMLREGLAQLTKYSRVLKEAPIAIVVFIDHGAMYNDVKDHQSVGACIQNMLLAAHAMGLGAVWLGEILKNADKVRVLLDLSDNLELMAVIALGHPQKTDQESSRRDIGEMLIREY